MMKLKSIKSNNSNELATAANGTAPPRDVNHGTKTLKEVLQA